MEISLLLAQKYFLNVRVCKLLMSHYPSIAFDRSKAASSQANSPIKEGRGLRDKDIQPIKQTNIQLASQSSKNPESCALSRFCTLF